MPTPSLDGNGLTIGGRRIHVRSGTIEYTRVPRDLWRDRLRRARRAGLNCVETTVVWAAHEPTKGKASFDDELDIKAFIQEAADAGLWTILRLGPYVGETWDRGGIPGWLFKQSEGDVRSPNAEFLAECSRYITAIARLVRDLQVTKRAAGEHGLLMAQIEHRWECGSETVGDAYVAELARFAREGGIDVPLIGANNLFYTVEGELSAWCGYSLLHSHTRQLRFLQPGQPAYIAHLPLGAPDVWAQPRRSKKSPADAQRRIAEVLAAGGHFNISPFCGGTNFAFSGGRLDGGNDLFATTSHDCDAPLSETGAPTDKFHAVRAICRFADSFQRILTSADLSRQPVAVSPDSLNQPITDEETGDTATARKARNGTITAIECRGSQGAITFLFTHAGAPANSTTTLILPSGAELEVPIPSSGIAWTLHDTHLAGRAVLDYCNLSALAHIGSLLVCFGPPGATAHLSVSGVPLRFTVPKGDAPRIELCEDITIAAFNEAALPSVHVGTDRVFFGATDIDTDGNPVGTGQCLCIDGRGDQTRVDCVPAHAAKAKRPRFESWETASCDDYIDGTNPRYATISGPADVDDLGVGEGYAWMRIDIRTTAARKHQARVPEASDRVHFYVDNELCHIAGIGPDASRENFSLPLAKGDNTVAVLVDNLGHFSRGTELNDAKGLRGHLWETRLLRTGVPRLEPGEPLNPLDHRAAVMGVDSTDRTDPDRITWKFTYRRTAPLFMHIPGLDAPALLIINDEVTRILTTGGDITVRLDPDALKRGNNVVQIATIANAEDLLKTLKNDVSFLEGKTCITERASWAFAKWEQPGKTAFEPVETSGNNARKLAEFKGRPRWWRTTFSVSHTDAPLLFDAAGLSKGQLFLNGRNLGRYWVATRTGKKVPPQTRYYLPEPWLHTGKPNELLIFDEHGMPPKSCKLTYSDKGPFA